MHAESTAPTRSGEKGIRPATSDVTDWYRLSLDEVLERLGVDPKQGLDDQEVERRAQRWGKNELLTAEGRGPLRILIEQLRGAMVLLLIGAAMVSAWLGEWYDASAITAIIVLNALLGFVQDFRAERAMLALKKMAVPRVKVRRAGRVQVIDARDLVPGDIVLLEAGSRVPADGRLLKAIHFRVQEAALTGESEAVEKDAHFVASAELPVGDRRNMVFMGTDATYGRAVAVVTAIGMQTELGRIAEMLRSVKPESTPLQRRLDRLGRSLAVVALAIVAVMFVAGVVRGAPLTLMFMTALSMAVAVVPEGLPAVATLTLAIGAQTMLRRNALIRRLPAVETLGSVTVICSDKTGTLTENRMTVALADIAGERIQLLERLGQKQRPLSGDAQRWLEEHPALSWMLVAGSLCNDATLERSDGESRRFEAIGDPTETALVVAAAEFGLWKTELEKMLPRVAEVPFDSQRKRMSTVHQVPEASQRESIRRFDMWLDGDDGYVVFTKGALGSVLERCTRCWTDDGLEPLDDARRKQIVRENEELASQGMRILGIAYRRLARLPEDVSEETIERELAFLGLVGMTDPARPEVAEAVRRCQQAGIRPVMITGDHPLTALAIARELGISQDNLAITGRELSSMPTEELRQQVQQVSVYARVAPEHKLNIVDAFQRNGHIVAMTGDGVNDAPALKKADIGVAMGITGTDVAKEAADMVLLDDNFATIVNAVEAGRVIYDNIRKFLKYTLGSNVGEMLVMLVAPFLGMPLPLLPLQILWVNLVTDGLPGLALSVEPAEPDTMRRPPYPPSESVLSRGIVRDIFWIGTVLAALSLATGWWYWRVPEQPDEYWRTMVFTVLTLGQLGNALAIRSSREALWTIGLWSNRFMLVSVLLTVGLQMLVVYLPALQVFFKTTALRPVDMAVCFVTSGLAFIAVEAGKWFFYRRGSRGGVAPVAAAGS